MQRVMIIGQPGSGKSTFARALGDITFLPVIHIDREVHWNADWIETPSEEKTRRCHEIHARPSWIFEGGHSRTWPERLERADTLIWLDIPIGTRLWRVVWRTLRHHGQSRPDLPEGCPERFDSEFLHWIWDTRKTARAGCSALFNSCPPEKTRAHIKSGLEAHRWLDALREAVAVGNLGIPHR